MRGVFFLTILCFSMLVASDEKPKRTALLFTPGFDKFTHIRSINAARDSLNRAGYSVQKSLVGHDGYGHYMHNFRGQTLTNTGIKSLTDNLSSSFTSLDNGGSMFVHIGGHGSIHAGKGGAPAGVGYTTYNKKGESESITVGELLAEFKKYPLQKTNKKIKLNVSNCNSGGIHHLSHNLENVCSAAPVNAFQTHSITPNPDTNEMEDFYSTGFYAETKRKTKTIDLDDDSKTSLFEAWMAGMKLNFEKSTIANQSGYPSSIALIDTVLGTNRNTTGRRRRDRIPARLNRQFANEIARASLNNIDDGCSNLVGEYDTLKVGIIQKFERYYVPVMKGLKKDNFLKSVESLPNNTKVAMTKFGDMAMELAEKAVKKYVPKLKPIITEYNALIAKKPQFMRDLQKKLDKMSEHEAEFNRWARLEARYDGDPKKKKEHAEAERKMNQAQRRYTAAETSKNQFVKAFQDKFKDLDNRSAEAYGALGYAFKMTQMMDKMVLFMQVADKKQKEKLAKLLTCELEAL